MPTQVLDRVERQKAPHDLTDEETEIWVSIVNHEEADWFSPSTSPILAQYCRHCVAARRVAELIERAVADKGLTVEDYEKLLKMQKEQSAILATLATKLRISQQSTINKRGNKKTASRKRLWEP